MKSLINAIDIETLGSEDLTPYCCCLILKGRKVNSYGLNCINNILNYIYSLRIENVLIFAHNLTFDGSLILSKLDSSWEVLSWRTVIRKGGIYSLCIKKGDYHIVFRCSSKLLPLELSEIAIRLKISKKIPLDHKSINIQNFSDTCIKNKVTQYCERDTEIVNQFMVKLSLSLNKYIKDWYVNCYSISGIAYSIYKNYFNKFNIKLNLDYETDKNIRNAYYGGRCEVFGNPYEDDFIFHFDFTGMYSNRLKEDFPIGDPVKIDRPLCTREPGFYFIKVKSDMNIPILPYRCEVTGKLLFPNGVFGGIYWYEEISLFLQEGGQILEIYWGLVYEKVSKIFIDFAEHCINNRNNSLVDKVLWKMIPNSFIGRLGLRNDNEKTIIIDDKDYNPKFLDVISDKKINNKWIVRIKEENTRKTVSNVTYASIVTSKSRVIWWKHANKIIKDGGRILYCDTDSLFIAFKTNRIGSRWGEVYLDESKDDTVIRRACFACSKAYSIVLNKNNITKIKGIPQKDTNIMTFEEFEDLFRSDKNQKVRMDLFRKRNLKISIEEIFKVVKLSQYDKRIFTNDKRETKPLYIDM